MKMFGQVGQERSNAWKNLPKPRPSWETFKRMLPVFNNDPEKARQAWIKNQQRRASKKPKKNS